MVFLGQRVVFLLKGADALVEHLDGVFEAVGVGEPVLLLELLHALEVELGHTRRAVLALGILILNSPRNGVDRGVHQLVELDGVRVAHLLVVVDTRKPDAAPVVVRWQRPLVGFAFFKASLEFLHFLLLVAQLVVELDVLGLLLCELLLENENLFLHQAPLLVAHRLLLQLFQLLRELRSLLTSERVKGVLLRCKRGHLLRKGAVLALQVSDDGHQLVINLLDAVTSEYFTQYVLI